MSEKGGWYLGAMLGFIAGVATVAFATLGQPEAAYWRGKEDGIRETSERLQPLLKKIGAIDKNREE